MKAIQIPIRFSLVVILASALQGCGTPIVDKTDPTYHQFQELCETKAGTRIYSTVTGVEGIYDTTSSGTCINCISGVLRDGYSFVETSFGSQVPEDQLFRNFVAMKGLHRYELKSAGDPNCQNFYRFYEYVRRSGGDFPEVYKGKCIATTPIDVKASQYKVELNEIGNWVRGIRGEIAQIVTTYSSIDGRQIFAENRRIKYVPVNASRNFSTGIHESIKCPENKFTAIPEPKVYEIFQPPNRPLNAINLDQINN